MTDGYDDRLCAVCGIPYGAHDLVEHYWQVVPGDEWCHVHDDWAANCGCEDTEDLDSWDSSEPLPQGSNLDFWPARPPGGWE